VKNQLQILLLIYKLRSVVELVQWYLCVENWVKAPYTVGRARHFHRSVESNLEQTASSLYAQTTQPQRDGKWIGTRLVRTTENRRSQVDWAVACLLTAPPVRAFVVAMNDRIMSCDSSISSR